MYNVSTFNCFADAELRGEASVCRKETFHKTNHMQHVIAAPDNNERKFS